MAGKELFLKKGFKAVDTAHPDYELMALSMYPEGPSMIEKLGLLPG